MTVIVRRDRLTGTVTVFFFSYFFHLYFRYVNALRRGGSRRARFSRERGVVPKSLPLSGEASFRSFFISRRVRDRREETAVDREIRLNFRGAEKREKDIRDDHPRGNEFTDGVAKPVVCVRAIDGSHRADRIFPRILRTRILRT